MFRGGKKEEKQRAPRSGANLPQFGIFDMPNIDTMGMGSLPPDDEEDDDLEAELMALMSGTPTAKGPPRPKPVKEPDSKLDAMVAASLKDVEDEEVSSGDEDDPDLLAELEVVTGEGRRVSPAPPPLASPPPPLASPPPAPSGVSVRPPDNVALLNERLANYREAEANAKALGDTAKSRRLGRGLKTLGDLLKKAEKGLVINEEDIPLPVATGGKKADSDTTSAINDDPPTDQTIQVLRPAPPPPVPPRVKVPEPDIPPVSIPGPGSSKQEEDGEKTRVLGVLMERRDEYKRAALIAKRNGDMKTALEHIKIIKQFEVVIAGVEAGQPADLSAMPPSPSSEEEVVVRAPRPRSPQPPLTVRVETGAPPPEAADDAPNQEPTSSSEPLSILDSLELRMAKFKEQEEAGKKDGNASKARRMGRIVRQYQDAIKLHKAGKPFPVEDLPTPPGFPPIPVERPTASTENTESVPVPVQKPSHTVPQPTPDIIVEPVPIGQEAMEEVDPQPAPRSPLPSPTPPGRKMVTRQEKQLAVLLARQKQYKEAALKAKAKGDIAQAKEYLRLVKGFDPLIEASNNGLPIDMNSIPVAPSSKKAIQEESGFAVVTIADCLPGSDTEIYDRLLTDLQNQFKLCMETRNHFKSMGDIANANKFEQLAVHSKKDLDTVRVCHKRSDPVPKFHYEKRAFSIVRCNIDLGDNDLELSIIQGINYNVPNPKEIDTYVRFEFPGLNDDTKKDKTNVIYNTNNPSYEAVFPIPIQRTVRAFQRLFKRHAIKCEVWSKGGFLRSDILIGTVNVKLQPLETKCTIHDSFDLMDGRKTVGGKLEVKVRIRHPIQTKQIEQVEEKWLVIV